MGLRRLLQDLKKEKRILQAGTVLLIIAAVLALVVLHFDAVGAAVAKVAGLLSPLLWGVIFAYIFNAVVAIFHDLVLRPMKDSRARQPVAVILSVAVVGFVVFFFFWYIIPHVLESLNVLVETLQRTLPQLFQDAVREINAFVDRHNIDFVREYLQNFNWNDVLSAVTGYSTQVLGSLANVTINVVSNVAGTAFSLVMGFIFSIYFLTGKRKLLRGLRSTILAFFPARTSHRLREVSSLTNQVFSSFLRGQLTECLILGIECYVGMSILRLDYALLVSFLVAMGPLVPILGAYLSAAVGALILLTASPIQALIFLVFLLILMQIEANLVYPRIVGASIGLPPVWTVFAVLFWSGLLGIPGILLGTPVTAVIYRLFRARVRSRLEKKGIDPDNPRLGEKDMGPQDPQLEQSPTEPGEELPAPPEEEP